MLCVCTDRWNLQSARNRRNAPPPSTTSTTVWSASSSRRATARPRRTALRSVRHLLIPRLPDTTREAQQTRSRPTSLTLWQFSTSRTVPQHAQPPSSGRSSSKCIDKLGTRSIWCALIRRLPGNCGSSTSSGLFVLGESAIVAPEGCILVRSTDMGPDGGRDVALQARRSRLYYNAAAHSNRTTPLPASGCILPLPWLSLALCFNRDAWVGATGELDHGETESRKHGSVEVQPGRCTGRKEPAKSTTPFSFPSLLSAFRPFASSRYQPRDGKSTARGLERAPVLVDLAKSDECPEAAGGYPSSRN